MENSHYEGRPSRPPGAEEWNNFKNPESGMDKYGIHRLQLALFLRDNVLNAQPAPWMIEAGTLLGAWRHGKFIPHDDDFDIAIFYDKDAKSRFKDEFERIQKLLPSPYGARLITTYTDKIEVFDSTRGSYLWDYDGQGTHYHHHVTVDIQPYELRDDVYHSLYKSPIREFFYRREDVVPLSTITLEGEEFPAPHNTEASLKGMYGSLSPNAKYNKELGIYEDPDEV